MNRFELTKEALADIDELWATLKTISRPQTASAMPFSTRARFLLRSLSTDTPGRI